mmetsp:Transcript_35859/g.78286  ORF Transcript_35859/g.78286 Transcript_35859/m.78286 type:complete len:134 (-) Transcript_35859:385-786(-)|eukprot:CAMPEP_0118926890 /NCGR_PEP_ID=MMETSP1169-20130426/4499_1 /TAXON_ID=36882 /ORGANISM="Pyramimonas obovata, Strain CCMP722" /LENGTH=133 /DNA_ID=CAMNT_0006868543 /DNA_START=46 /DNA_END=447 /DNA_ORIENTATION=-
MDTTSKEEDHVASNVEADRPSEAQGQSMEMPEVSSESESRGARLWASICRGYHTLEELLADFFGLNDSKYQWAIDEYFKEEEERERRRQLRAARRAQKQREEDGEYTAMEDGQEGVVELAACGEGEKGQNSEQ